MDTSTARIRTGATTKSVATSEGTTPGSAGDRAYSGDAIRPPPPRPLPPSCSLQPSSRGPLSPPSPRTRTTRASAAGRTPAARTGVGYYKMYRYGTRWFGDYRDVVAGTSHTLLHRPALLVPVEDRRLQRALDRDAGLRNRAGQAVSASMQQEIAYAVWNAGQSNDPNRQAAVMLYVHSRMGDAAPGEVDPSALGSSVSSLYASIARDAARYHGPYRIVGVGALGHRRRPRHGHLPRALRVRRSRARRGADAERDRCDGVPAKVDTNARGVASVPLTSSSVDGVSVDVHTGTLASTLPRVYAASKPPPPRTRSGSRSQTPRRSRRPSPRRRRRRRSP